MSIRYNEDGSITFTGGAKSIAMLEDAFKQEWYKNQKSTIVVLKEHVYMNTTDEVRHRLNSFVRAHYPGNKIQAYCIRFDGVHIRIRPMNFLEADRSKKYQRLFAHTNNLAVLSEDPLWELELTGEEFRQELQNLKQIL